MLELLSDTLLRIIFPNVVTPLEFSRSTQLETLAFGLFLIHLSSRINKNAAVEGEVCGLK